MGMANVLSAILTVVSSALMWLSPVGVPSLFADLLVVCVFAVLLMSARVRSQRADTA